MKRFADYTDAELLAISKEDLNDAIRLEGLERGIKPPIPLSEAIRKSEWVGYQKPGDGVKVWEVMTPTNYNSQAATGLAFLSEEAASKAIEGAVGVENVTYGASQGWHIRPGSVSLAVRFVGSTKATQRGEKFEEYAQDDTDFNTLVEECMTRFDRVRQEDYNKRVFAERRAEYLRLASGNEEIAKAFWNKAERTDWPAE